MSEHQPVLRASDAEREHAVVRLREAAAEGRLTLEEFTERMTAAYETRTRAELEALVGDLPEHAPLPAAAGTRTRWVVAFMGESHRRGRWRVGRRTNVVTWMGNSVLDLREAVLSSPEIELRVVGVMGNTSVIVPHGVDVEVDAIPLLGNRVDATRPEGRPGAPLVRITGVVLMGNLTVRSA